MKVVLQKEFRKGLNNLTPKQKVRVGAALKQFEDNPHHSRLKNHALHGKLQGYRAISAGGNLRLIFEVEGDYDRVKFIRVGTHNQVYEIVVSTLLLLYPSRINKRNLRLATH